MFRAVRGYIFTGIFRVPQEIPREFERRSALIGRHKTWRPAITSDRSARNSLTLAGTLFPDYRD